MNGPELVDFLARWHSFQHQPAAYARGVVTGTSGDKVLVKLTGEASASTEAYPKMNYTPVTDDDVILARIAGRWVVLGKIGSAGGSAYVHLAEPVTILNGAVYTSSVATPTALDLSAAVPAEAVLARISLGMKDTGAVGAFYACGSNHATGVYEICARTAVSNLYDETGGLVTVTARNLYFVRTYTTSMTVYLRVYGYFVG